MKFERTCKLTKVVSAPVLDPQTQHPPIIVMCFLVAMWSILNPSAGCVETVVVVTIANDGQRPFVVHREESHTKTFWCKRVYACNRFSWVGMAMPFLFVRTFLHTVGFGLVVVFCTSTEGARRDGSLVVYKVACEIGGRGHSITASLHFVPCRLTSTTFEGVGQPFSAKTLLHTRLLL